jgi:hypothetical protein
VDLGADDADEQALWNWCTQAKVRAMTQRTRPSPEPCSVWRRDLGRDPALA